MTNTHIVTVPELQRRGRRVCLVCSALLETGEDCGCWVCRCCELQPETMPYVNRAGERCAFCGHERGCCICAVECACGLLHPVGYVCAAKPATGDNSRF